MGCSVAASETLWLQPESPSRVAAMWKPRTKFKGSPNRKRDVGPTESACCLQQGVDVLVERLEAATLVGELEAERFREEAKCKESLLLANSHKTENRQSEASSWNLDPWRGSSEAT